MNIKSPASAGLFIYGGEGGIRTLDSTIETEQRDQICDLINASAALAGLETEKQDITEDWRACRRIVAAHNNTRLVAGLTDRLKADDSQHAIAQPEGSAQLHFSPK